MALLKLRVNSNTARFTRLMLSFQEPQTERLRADDNMSFTRGVLHLHLFINPQLATRFAILLEVAEKLRARVLSSRAWKEYVSHVRCAAYPDAERAETDRRKAEETWPTYATD